MPEDEKFRHTRRQLTTVVGGLAVAGLAGPLAGIAGATPGTRVEARAGGGGAGAPLVVPALQEWTDGSGEFRLTASSRISVSPGDAQLLRLAHTVTEELAELTGVRIRAPRVGDGEAQEGEIQLARDPHDVHSRGGERYRDEGSRIVVTDRHIRIAGPGYAGVFYGTRSLLQMLVRDQRCTVPGGTAVDWPDYAHRGCSLDVARRYFTPAFIRDYVRLLGWFKYNDLQLHLNDNEIEAPDGDWNKAYSAFRLAADSAKWSGLAAPDGAYSRRVWESFEDLGASCAVRITPEFDAPAHSRAFVAFRPGIGLKDGNSDHLDLGNPQATAFMKDLFTEFAPWFRSPVVHFGADEYGGPVEQYHAYFDTLAAHLKDLGKKPAAWGSLSEIGGTAKGYDRDVLMYSWNNDWYGPQAIKRDGFDFVNINDAQLYLVPYADYYHGQGLDGRHLYEEWAPHVFPDGQSVEPFEPGLQGGMFGVWNDLVHEDYTERDVHKMINKTLGVLGQKMWSGDGAGVPYADFQQRVSELGLGPGLELLGK